MIQAIQLVFSPFQTWEKITASRRSFLGTVFVYLLPFLLAGVALEAYSLVHAGETRGAFDSRVKISEPTAMRYGIAQAGLLLISIAAGARFLQAIARSFQVETQYSQSFTLMAYGFSPIILARYLDAIPALHTWVAWLLGALVALSVLYHGVALVLKPEQTKGFGLYLVSVLLVLVLSGLSHFAARAVLQVGAF